MIVSVTVTVAHARRAPLVAYPFVAALSLAAVSLAGCGRAERAATAPAAIATESEVPRFQGLGTHTRPVTTASKDAQAYFDQGLNFLFAFNHDEAIRSFRRAAVIDPACAMAWWGVAIANGPHINNPLVTPERAAAAFEAVGRARAAAANASAKPTEVERALIEALGARYADPNAAGPSQGTPQGAAPPPGDRTALDHAYANAMRSLWRSHPKDADIGALFAESLMDLRPWDLWTPDSKPQPGTDEVLATLESVLAIAPTHPLALHLTIHALEMSTTPEKADTAADRLRELTPGLGHLVHMPSHIDVRRGRWVQAMTANEKAMEADRRYNAQVPRQGFYGLYISHNHHMFAYAAMMVGQSGAALKAIDAMVARMPEEWKREYSAIADGFSAMPLEVRMRFGKWEEILAAPEPPQHLPIARAMRLYARGVALAATGKPTEARAEQKAFETARAAVPAEAQFGNNTGAGILTVAAHLLEGEIAYREGKVDDGLAAMRKGVAAEDGLRYDEPPDWILPVRHALGAALLQSGKHSEAETVFRDDLKRLPDNGWSLFGLGRALRLQKKDKEATDVEARFKNIWSGADIELKSSCFCQPGV
jgi:tetratricopeptide (TPR) repeat protein